MTLWVEPQKFSITLRSIELCGNQVDNAEPGDIAGLRIDCDTRRRPKRGSIAIGGSSSTESQIRRVDKFSANMIVLRDANCINVGAVPVLFTHSASVPCKLDSIVQKIDKATGRDFEDPLTTLRRGDCAIVTLIPCLPLALQRNRVRRGSNQRGYAARNEMAKMACDTTDSSCLVLQRSHMPTLKAPSATPHPSDYHRVLLPNHKREQNEYAETHSGLASGSTFALGDCLSTDSLSQIFLGNACETQLRTPLEPSTISDPQFSTPKRSSNRPPLETSPNYYSKVLSPSSKFLDFLSFDSDSFSGKYNSPLQLRQDLLSQILPSVTTTIPLSTAPVEVKEQRDSFAQSSNTLSSTASTQPVTALPLSAQHNQKCGYPESLEPQAKVVDSEELYVPKIAELTSCPSLIVASSPPELQPAEFNAQSPIHELSALTAPPNLHRKRQGNSRLPKAITDKRPRKGSVDTTSKTQVLPQNILATVPAKGRGWSEQGLKYLTLAVCRKMQMKNTSTYTQECCR
ncbi:hypothetical protein Pelo_6706 [Pelomyxa schiedti]|nr:hypothetical protein Pelo_6706 [Pelomyxa schiedti]